MRQRKVKNLDEKLEAVSAYMVEDPSPEVWAEVFGTDAGSGTDTCTDADTCSGAEGAVPAGRDLYLEIGCGKGDFLLQQALAHPEHDYIGIEGQASVVLRALQKAAEAGSAQDGGLRNLRFACAFVNHLEELFAPGSLAGIFLNFSDPWPKERHAKRRLTYRGRLQNYAKALKKGGFIAVKTDNDALFDFTLEEIEASGFKPAELTRDLHGEGCSYEARHAMTEYEKKFHEAGKHINYIKVIV